MQVSSDGLIIMEKAISENDKLVTILTRKFGIIRAFAKGVKSIKNKNFSSRGCIYALHLLNICKDIFEPA
mgnify:CR=1 FL=1